MAWIEILKGVSGTGFRWRRGQLVELPDAEAAQWADGYRARLVDPPPRTPSGAEDDDAHGDGDGKHTDPDTDDVDGDGEGRQADRTGDRTDDTGPARETTTDTPPETTTDTPRPRARGGRGRGTRTRGA